MSATAGSVDMLQDRLASLMNSSGGYVESLPKRARARVTALKGVQAQLGELESLFQKEVSALEKKYDGLYQPLFDRRSELVSGSGPPPTEEELKLGKEAVEIFGFVAEEDEVEEPSGSDRRDVAGEADGVPDFWLKVLKNHPDLADIITESDEPALRAMTDIRTAYLRDEKPGFRLLFHFAENEFFSNEVLGITYYYQGNGADGEVSYDRAEGTKVDWKPGKDVTVRVEVKRQRHKGTGRTREVSKTVPVESFFNIFSPPWIPDNGEEGDGDDEERLDFVFEVGEELKEKVIPHAVDWFTGRALLYGDMNEAYNDEEEESEGDDDENESNDEDEENRGHKIDKVEKCTSTTKYAF